MTGAAVRADGLEVRYRGAPRPAVRAMTFQVAPGEVFGLLGPSGAGKSTVQKVLTRVVRGYGGTVRALGRPLPEWGSDYFEHVGVGFELPAAYTRLTARENLAAFASLYRGPVEDPGKLLDRLDLGAEADRRVAELSKGMRMRLNLARALINRPRLLLLDEPTSGQDPVRAARIRAIVRAEADRGAAVLLSTHDMTTAERLCDRVAFVAGGRIAAVDTPAAFKLRHGRPGLRAEYTEHGALRRRTFDPALPDDAAELSRIIAGGGLASLHTREAALDEVFAEVTKVRL
ncbi:ABC transporter ATP-binding protein [Nocardiopsis potens]|uniref:ABC transporter ATP-binding protein n=1 Tax=Nocardiopsis potens TaxID=1246458 RepID=UPI000348F010|nr:ABC transporter ATP-binding protein [Nocardiopsis potens]